MEASAHWRSKNITRYQLRDREYGTTIKGISQKLEDLSPAIGVHGTRYINRIVAADTTVEVASRSAESTAVDAAGRVEAYHNFTVAQLKKQRTAGILLPLRRAVSDMTYLGAGWLRSGFKPGVRERLFGEDMPKDKDQLVTAIAKAYKEGFDEDPFLVECPMLDTVGFEDDRRNICEKGTRTVSQLLRLYEDVRFDSDTQTFSDLTSETRPEHDATWDKTEVHYFHLETEGFIYDLVDSIDGEHPFLLETIPNPIGRPWYTLFAGHVENRSEPSKKYLPLVNDIYSIVLKLNVTNTLLNSMALATGRPMYQQVDISASRGMATQYDVLSMPTEQRGVVMFSESETMLDDPAPGKRWELVPANDMSWVLEANREAKAELKEYGFPTILSPETSTSGTADSGIQGQQQIEVSVNYLDPALTNVALALQELFSIHQDAIRELDTSVTIPVTKEGGDSRQRELITIKPADFKDVDISVALKSIPTSALMAVMSFDLELVQAKMMSKRDFFMKHYKNWQIAMKNVLLDEVKAMGEGELLKLTQAFMQNQGPAVFAEAAAELGIPLDVPGLANQSGGPAPGEATRQNRPPQPLPGVGAPNVPVDQNPASSAGTAQTVQV